MGVVTTALMKIKNGSISRIFLLPAKLSSIFSYSSDYAEAQGSRSPELLSSSDKGLPGLQWQKGKDDPVSITLELFVGVSYGIDSPQDLLDTVADLVSMSLPTKLYGDGVTGDLPGITEIYIGNWFYRKCLVKSVQVEFGKPYDLQDGKPYYASVTLNVQFLYDKPLPTRDTFDWS